MPKSLGNPEGGHLMIWVTQGVTQHAAYLLEEKEGWKFVRWVTTRQDAWIDPSVQVQHELPSRRSRGPRPNYNDSIVAVSAAAEPPGSRQPPATEAPLSVDGRNRRNKLKRGMQTKRGRPKKAAAEPRIPRKGAAVAVAVAAAIHYKDDDEETTEEEEERIPRKKRRSSSTFEATPADESSEGETEWKVAPAMITSPSNPAAAAKKKQTKKKSKKQNKKNKSHKKRDATEDDTEDEDDTDFLDGRKNEKNRPRRESSQRRSVNYKEIDSDVEDEDEKDWSEALRTAVSDRTAVAKAAALGHCNAPSSEERPPNRRRKEEKTMRGRDAEPDGEYRNESEDEVVDEVEDADSTDDPHELAADSPLAPSRSYPVGVMVAKQCPSVGWVSGKVVSVEGNMYTVEFQHSDTAEIIPLCNMRAMVEDADMSRYPIGAPVRKEFPGEEGGWCSGSVISLDNLYQVVYENGREERLGASAVDAIVIVPQDANETKLTAKAAAENWRKQTAGQCTASDAPATPEYESAQTGPDNDPKPSSHPATDAKPAAVNVLPSHDTVGNKLAADDGINTVRPHSPTKLAPHPQLGNDAIDYQNTYVQVDANNGDQGENTDSLLPAPDAAQEHDLSSPASADKSSPEDDTAAASQDARSSINIDHIADSLVADGTTSPVVNKLLDNEDDNMQDVHPQGESESAVDLFLNGSGSPIVAEEPEEAFGVNDAEAVVAEKMEIPPTIPNSLAVAWAKLTSLYPPKHGESQANNQSSNEPKATQVADEDISVLTSRAVLNAKKESSVGLEISDSDAAMPVAALDANRSKVAVAAKITKKSRNDGPPVGQPMAKKPRLAAAVGKSTQRKRTQFATARSPLVVSGRPKRGADPPGELVSYSVDAEMASGASMPLPINLPARPPGVARGYRAAAKPRTCGRPRPRKVSTRPTLSMQYGSRPVVKSYSVKLASSPKSAKWSSWTPTPSRPLRRAATQPLFCFPAAQAQSQQQPNTDKNDSSLAANLRRRLSSSSTASNNNVVCPANLGMAPMQPAVAPPFNGFPQSFFNNPHLIQRWNAFNGNFSHGNPAAPSATQVPVLDPSTMALYFAALQQNQNASGVTAQPSSAMPQLQQQFQQQVPLPQNQLQNQQPRRNTFHSATHQVASLLPRNDPP